MKGLIAIIVLLGIAGTIFVAGWIQILLPPATYAVLFSKTGGFDPRVIAPGTFAWRWERVIPGNVTLFLFDVQPASITTRISGELPSADAVASVLPGDVDFRYQATITVTFSVRPEALPQLVEMEGMLPESLPEWTRAQAETIADAAVELMQRDSRTTGLPDLALDTAEIALLNDRFRDVEVRAVRLDDVRPPDLELYQQARHSYMALLDARYEARRLAASNLAAQRERDVAALEARRDALEVLREYGVVLQQYPVLIQFLALQNDAGRDAFIELPAAPGGAPATAP